MHSKNFLKKIVIFTTIIISGCSSSPKINSSYSTNESFSRALNIVNASGINHTGSVSDFKTANISEMSVGKDVDSVAITSMIASGSAATGMFSLPNMTYLESAGFLLIPAILPRTPGVHEFDRWIVWMPKNDLTPKQAQEYLENIFSKSFLEINPDSNIQVNKPSTGFAPNWLGGYEAYTWGVSSRILSSGSTGYIHVTVPGCNFAQSVRFADHAMERECLFKLTESLPEWAYFYSNAKVRPLRVAEVDDDGNEVSVGFQTPRNGAYPLVYNQGKAYFFIEPQGEDVEES